MDSSLSQTRSDDNFLEMKEHDYKLSQVRISKDFLIQAKSVLDAQYKLKVLLQQNQADYYEITINDYILVDGELQKEVQDKLNVFLEEIQEDSNILLKACLSMNINL